MVDRTHLVLQDSASKITVARNINILKPSFPLTPTVQLRRQDHERGLRADQLQGAGAQLGGDAGAADQKVHLPRRREETILGSAQRTL